MMIYIKVCTYYIRRNNKTFCKYIYFDFDSSKIITFRPRSPWKYIGWKVRLHRNVYISYIFKKNLSIFCQVYFIPDGRIGDVRLLSPGLRFPVGISRLLLPRIRPLALHPQMLYINYGRTRWFLIGFSRYARLGGVLLWFSRDDGRHGYHGTYRTYR